MYQRLNVLSWPVWLLVLLSNDWFGFIMWLYPASCLKSLFPPHTKTERGQGGRRQGAATYRVCVDDDLVGRHCFSLFFFLNVVLELTSWLYKGNKSR